MDSPVGDPVSRQGPPPGLYDKPQRALVLLRDRSSSRLPLTRRCGLSPRLAHSSVTCCTPLFERLRGFFSAWRDLLVALALRQAHGIVDESVEGLKGPGIGLVHVLGVDHGGQLRGKVDRGGAPEAADNLGLVDASDLGSARTQRLRIRVVAEGA